MKSVMIVVAAVLAISAGPVLAGGSGRQAAGDWWSLGTLPAAADAAPAADAETAQPHPDHGEKKMADRKGPPLPFHSIEGYSGGAITPMAYICNFCQCGCGSRHFTPPSISYSYMDLGSKDLHTIAVTQSFLGRFEFGYALNRLSTGSLDDDIKAAGGDPVRKHVYMHNFNFRAMVLQENSFEMPLPAVTVGVHFKYNHDIDIFNHRLGDAFGAIGYARHYGVDYTIVASKMFPELAFGRPVILTCGVRFTRASQLGLLGFGKSCNVFLEGSVVCMPTDWLILGYEFRQKESPYDKIPGLIGEEDNWHAFSVSWMASKHLTISALYGLTGHVANASADKTLGLQIKWEF